MKMSLLRCLSFTSLFLLSITGCAPTPPPPADATSSEPLSFSAPQPEFTTTVLEADLPSPRKEMRGELNDVQVTVNYGSPSTKGRAIWGSLVPYDEVWRTGANEATKITLDEDVIIQDKPLAAGTYGLFTIPHEDGWEVIFNDRADQWGAYEYKAEQDVLRVNVQPVTIDSLFRTMEFVLVPGALQMRWDKLAVPIPLEKA